MKIDNKRYGVKAHNPKIIFTCLVQEQVIFHEEPATFSKLLKEDSHLTRPLEHLVLQLSLASCRGQAYDTTASMSSNKKGVKAEIASNAPDAEYQGCCLHSLNLAICHACQIKSVKNMDCCRELYSVFDNSPTRQILTNIVIDAHSPESKKRKLKIYAK